MFKLIDKKLLFNASIQKKLKIALHRTNVIIMRKSISKYFYILLTGKITYTGQPRKPSKIVTFFYVKFWRLF